MHSEHTEHLSQWKQWLAAFAATSVMLSSTVDTVWATRSEYLTTELQDILSSTGFIIIGAILGAVFADICGRRKTLLLASLFVIPRVASLNIFSAYFSWTNKRFMDIGSGIICTVVPLYISEIADTNIRGTLMVVQLSVFTFGVLVSKIAYAVLRSYHIIHWNVIVTNVIMVIPTSFHVMILAVLPETPHYLNWKKRYEEASRSLARFRGIDHVKVREDVSEASENVLLHDQERSWIKKFRDIIRVENRRSFAIIFSLIVFKWASGQQRNESGLMALLGYNGWSINYFLPTLWAVKLVSAICIMFFIDVGGQKLTLLVVSFGSFFAAIILLFPIKNYHWIIFGSLPVPILGHIVFTAVELAYIGSFFPINVRAIASAIIISFEVLTRNATLALEELVYSMLLVPFAISASVLLCTFFFVLIFFPKTNYLPCSEMIVEIPTRRESLPSCI